MIDIAKAAAHCTCESCRRFDERPSAFLRHAIVERDSKPAIVPVEQPWRPSDGGAS